MTSIYAQLSARFEPQDELQDVRGGVPITYISGESVVSRLNDVLGPGGWSFSVLHQEIHPEADEAWVLGHLEAWFAAPSTEGPRLVVREQYGSQKIARARSTGVPLDIGFTYKSAATDALKKCASLIGVGLYLSHKEAPPQAQRQHTAAPPPRPAAPPPQRAPATSSPPPAPKPPSLLVSKPHPPAAPPSGTTTEPAFGTTCEECGKKLENVLKDGAIVWSAADLAQRGIMNFDRVLCADDYKIADAARKATAKR